MIFFFKTVTSTLVTNTIYTYTYMYMHYLPYRLSEHNESLSEVVKNSRSLYIFTSEQKYNGVKNNNDRKRTSKIIFKKFALIFYILLQ